MGENRCVALFGQDKEEGRARMNGPLKYDVEQMHQMANRLFNTLLHAGPVRVRLGELRDAASSFNLALDNGQLSPHEFCRVANEINQLNVFLCNVGTGLEQQGQHGFRPEMNQLTLDHLGRWTKYLNELAVALNSRTGDEWVNQNAPPSGQPDIPQG
jgi:hypothetical protein